MRKETKQTFGGPWTREKLTMVRNYLHAYSTALSSQPFDRYYVDAFAGTGYENIRKDAKDREHESELDEQLEFLKGSAPNALEVTPPFQRYIFIDLDAEHATELAKLGDEYPTLAAKISVVREDANAYLQRFCTTTRWTSKRAVVFLDPYGMQVEWNTIAAIAQTQAIDLWLLFPLGMGVNRLLRRDGQIEPVTRNRLDVLFGATDWYHTFYQPDQQLNIFDEAPKQNKVANTHGIGDYFNQRLKTVFAGVANNPKILRNSKNAPLYLLCFACGNPKGCNVALKIAQHILGKG